MNNIILYKLQLKYYNSNMFRPTSGYLQGLYNLKIGEEEWNILKL